MWGGAGPNAERKSSRFVTGDAALVFDILSAFFLNVGHVLR